MQYFNLPQERIFKINVMYANGQTGLVRFLAKNLSRYFWIATSQERHYSLRQDTMSSVAACTHDS